MTAPYNCATAFIIEGATEYEFYQRFIKFICDKHGFEAEIGVDDNDGEQICIVRNGEKSMLIRYHSVNGISNMSKAAPWFETQCIKRYKCAWIVCLCYDTDDYLADITKFHEGDWANLRRKLRGAREIIDMAASADIEDIMLIDKKGICDYLGIEPEQFPDVLAGKKGKRKMKNLFRMFGDTYQEGERAAYVIDNLDMQKLIDEAPVPFGVIERRFLDELRF